MRTQLLIALAAVLLQAAVPSTASCPGSATAVSSCGAFVACQRDFCSCVGAPNASASSFACVAHAPSNATCASIAACNTELERCVGNVIVGYRANFTSACGPWAAFHYASALEAAASGFSGSRLERECLSRRCLILNRTNPAVCTAAAMAASNHSSVCAAAGLVASEPIVLLNSTLRLLGSHFGSLLDNGTRQSSLSAALRGDLTLLLHVPSSTVVVSSMRLGSLVANFSVFQGASSSTSVADLLTRIGSGNRSASWLIGVQDLYGTVSSERVAVGGFTVSAAASPSTAAASQPPTDGGLLTATPAPTTGVPKLTLSAGTRATASLALTASLVVAWLTAPCVFL